MLEMHVRMEWEMESQDLEALAEKAADLIISSRKVVVFTGAGVSTESGIPDFRSPGGIWERFNPEDFTYQKFISDPESRRRQWQMLREGMLTGDVAPNPAHDAIRSNRLLGLVLCSCGGRR